MSINNVKIEGHNRVKMERNTHSKGVVVTDKRAREEFRLRRKKANELDTMQDTVKRLQEQVANLTRMLETHISNEVPQVRI